MSCEKHCETCQRERLANEWYEEVYGGCKSLADFNRAAWRAGDLPGIVVNGWLLIRLFWRIVVMGKRS